MSIALDEKTKVSLYAVGAIIPFLIGGILWLASVASDAKEAKIQVQDLRVLVEQTRDSQIRMEEQLKMLRGYK